MGTIVCISITLVIYIILTILLWVVITKKINQENFRGVEEYKNIDLKLGGGGNLKAKTVTVDTVEIESGGSITIGVGSSKHKLEASNFTPLNHEGKYLFTSGSKQIEITEDYLKLLKSAPGYVFQLYNTSSNNWPLRRKVKADDVGLWSDNKGNSYWNFKAPYIYP